jgi:hypothetical protein
MSPINTFDFADDATRQIWLFDLLAQVLTLLGWILLTLAACGLAVYLFGIFKLCRATSSGRESQPKRKKVLKLSRVTQPKPRLRLVASSRRKSL